LAHGVSRLGSPPPDTDRKDLVAFHRVCLHHLRVPRPSTPAHGARRLYARAAAAVGSNLLGGPLWQAWEAWEATRDSGSHDHLLPVLWHALAQPLKEAEAILARALALARATPAAAVAAAWLSADERAAVEAEVKAASAVAQATPAAAPAADGAAAAPEPVDPAAAAEAALSAAVCARAEARSASARAERAARAPLEAQLRRHYYHWKPLDAQQLVGWHAYLDFETARATAAAAGAQDEGACAAATARCMALFERCVVACAAYGEFWCRYANWLRAPRGPAAALALLVRSRPHAPAHVRLGLARALGYEETGDTEEAERAYAELAEALAAAPPSLAQPGVASALGGALVEVAIARFNFERRRQAEAKKGAPDAAGALLRADLAKARARALGATPADAELACAHVLALASRLASHLLAAPAGGAAASAADGARAVFDELLAAPAAGAPAAAAAAPAADSDGGADADATDGAPPPLALPRGALRKAWLAYASLETRCAALAPAAKGRGKAAAPADSAARRVCAVYARGLGLASLAEACGAAAASAGASAEQHVSAPDDRQLLLSCMRQYAADHALDAHWYARATAASGPCCARVCVRACACVCV
jgi:hypothetical protein